MLKGIVTLIKLFIFVGIPLIIVFLIFVTMPGMTSDLGAPSFLVRFMWKANDTIFPNGTKITAEGIAGVGKSLAIILNGFQPAAEVLGKWAANPLGRMGFMTFVGLCFTAWGLYTKTFQKWLTQGIGSLRPRNFPDLMKVAGVIIAIAVISFNGIEKSLVSIGPPLLLVAALLAMLYVYLPRIKGFGAVVAGGLINTTLFVSGFALIMGVILGGMGASTGSIIVALSKMPVIGGTAATIMAAVTGLGTNLGLWGSVFVAAIVLIACGSTAGSILKPATASEPDGKQENGNGHDPKKRK